MFCLTLIPSLKSPYELVSSCSGLTVCVTPKLKPRSPVTNVLVLGGRASEQDSSLYN